MIVQISNDNEKFETVINESILQLDKHYDIDFQGDLLVQIYKIAEDKIIITNAVDGWGKNCFNKMKNFIVKIK